MNKILLITLTGIIILGCEKEKDGDEITLLSHPLICNPDKISKDSIVYEKLIPSIVFQTLTEFNSKDSLFLDTFKLDINRDDRIDFSFYYIEFLSKGVYYKEENSSFKYIYRQTLDVRADSNYYLADRYFSSALLGINDIVDSLNLCQRNFIWSSFENITEPYVIGIIDYKCNYFNTVVDEFYLPFMFREDNEPRYGWIRLRFSIMINYFSVYPYNESKMKIEIIDYVYQKF